MVDELSLPSPRGKWRVCAARRKRCAPFAARAIFLGAARGDCVDRGDLLLLPPTREQDCFLFDRLPLRAQSTGMNRSRLSPSLVFAAVAAGVCLFAPLARALVVPVAEDTSSTTTGLLTP